jgi:hypothetical protein
MKKIISVAIYVTILLVSSACSKQNDNPTTPPVSNTTKITAGVYNLQAITLANNANVTTAIGVTKVKYYPDGNLIQTLSNGTLRAGKWEWLENETKIKISVAITGLPPSTTWSVVLLNDTAFNKKTDDLAALFGGSTLQYNQTRQ